MICANIGDYIAKDSPRRALSFVTELRAQCAKILPLRKHIAVVQNWVKKSDRVHMGTT